MQSFRAKLLGLLYDVLAVSVSFSLSVAILLGAQTLLTLTEWLYQHMLA